MSIFNIKSYFDKNIEFLREFTLEYLLKNKVMAPLLLPMILSGALAALIIQEVPFILFHKTDPQYTSNQLCFYPSEGCKELIVREMNHAKESIEIFISQLYSKKLREAIIHAKRRGVEVKFISNADTWNFPLSKMHFLLKEKIDCKSIPPKIISYNNYIIIDGKKLITGSFNMLRDEKTKILENIIFLTLSKEVNSYREHFNSIYNIAVSPLPTSEVKKKSKND